MNVVIVCFVNLSQRFVFKCTLSIAINMTLGEWVFVLAQVGKVGRFSHEPHSQGDGFRQVMDEYVTIRQVEMLVVPVFCMRVHKFAIMCKLLFR